MPRPKKTRRVGCQHGGRGFKPVGVPMSELDSELLTLDELEAIRLADLEGLYQEAAAELMDVSRQTFARILRQARHKVARALVDEQALLIADDGGIAQHDEEIPCPVHGAGRRRGRGCRCARRGKNRS